MEMEILSHGRGERDLDIIRQGDNVSERETNVNHATFLN